MDIVIAGGYTSTEEVLIETDLRSFCNREHNWLFPVGRGVIGLYQVGMDTGIDPIVAYIHNDVVMHEQGWDDRVITAFEDPQVGVVGFGGALCHGSSDLYKTPYKLQQLGRSYYFSNVDDAEVHGTRFTGEMDVAVLDGFALIVRRELLGKVGGWPVDDLIFHCYDYWLCCIAHRYDYHVRLVGVRCHHLGGRTSTGKEYNEWLLETHGKTDVQIHEEGHRFIYDQFRDVLPYSCQPSEVGLRSGSV